MASNAKPDSDPKSNPQTDTFDLIVIGGGPAGYTGAIRAAQLGMKVAIVEKRGALGGTCLNVGCIPSKALLDSSEHFAFAKSKAAKHGILLGEVKLDVGAMIKRKDDVVKGMTSGIAFLMKKNKIESIDGYGRVKDAKGAAKSVEIALAKGGSRTILAKNLLLATGSEPVELPFLKFDGKKIISSTEALELKQVPKRMVVIGGGVIGLELGSVWSRLGAQVTVVEFQPRIVSGVDAQVGAELQKSLTKQGLEFKLNTKCLGAKPKGDGLMVEVEDNASKEKNAIECDVVLVSTGRRPFTDGLGLEDAGIRKDKQGRVEIDDHFQTNVAGVYAVGDIVAGPMLAHKAEEEAVAAVEIMAGQAGHVNHLTIPNVIYTHPELASVGYTEEELKAKGVAYNVGTMPYLANGRAKAMDESEGFVKILADKRTDRVLGVHILGARASDMIAEAVSVMEFSGSAEDIARTCHAHPTLPEAVKEAALDVAKRRINL